MITAEVVRKELQNCKRPLFLFDDDVDGLSGFLLLYKFVGDGRGIPVKTAAGIDESYVRRVQEYAPDKVFILDVHDVHQEFLDKVSCPVIWIDHHPVIKRSKVIHFNPLANGEPSRPTAQLCYEITQENLWIAMVGMTGDWVYDQKLADEFRKHHPNLLPEEISTPWDALFNSPIGKISKMFDFILKGPISEVKKCMAVLVKIKSPQELIDSSSPSGKFIVKRFDQLNTIYLSLIKKAKTKALKSPLLVFTYKNEFSFTGNLSNELLYLFPEKIIIVAREASDMMRMSIRGKKNVRDPLKKSIEGLHDAHGGGHEFAVGGSVREADWKLFLAKMKKCFEESSKEKSEEFKPD